MCLAICLSANKIQAQIDTLHARDLINECVYIIVWDCIHMYKGTVWKKNAIFNSNGQLLPSRYLEGLVLK